MWKTLLKVLTAEGVFRMETQSRRDFSKNRLFFFFRTNFLLKCFHIKIYRAYKTPVKDIFGANGYNFAIRKTDALLPR